MQTIVTTEVIVSLVLGIGLIGLLSLRHNDRSTKLLIVCNILGILWNLTDGTAYFSSGRGLSDGLLFLIWLVAFLMGSIVYIFFTLYCQALISERLGVKARLYYIPIVLMIISALYLLFHIFSGSVFVIRDGVARFSEGVPKEYTVGNLLLLVLLPIISAIHAKEIGFRNILLLGFYGVMPFIAIVIMLISNNDYDYTPVCSALAIMVVTVLLQNNRLLEKEEQYNKLLEEKNDFLTKVNEDQEARIAQVTELNKDLAEYNDIVATAGYGIWHIYLKEGEAPRMHVNEKMAELLGIDRDGMTEEEIYTSWYSRIEPDAIPSVQDSVQEMIDGKLSENTYEWRHPEQGVIYVRCGGTAVKLEDGTNVLSGYHANVTELVLKEQHYKDDMELAKINAEKHSEELKNRLDIINSLAKAYNSILYIDMRDFTFEELGLNAGEVTKAVGGQRDVREAFAGMIQDLVAREMIDEVREFTNLDTLKERLKDREWITNQFMGHEGWWFEGAFIAANRDADGYCEHIIWATRSIDEHKKKELEYQKALKEATSKAQAANEAKTLFLFNMSHDIRTPMNAIIGYTELLERHHDNPEKYLDYIAKIRSSSDFLLSLINNVLEMARIESGKVTLDESIYESGYIVSETYSVYSELMRKKGITFTKSSNIRTKYVYGDIVKLKEILLNVISNAYKYTLAGGTISLMMEEIPTSKPGYTVFRTTVSDTGIGMAKQYIPHLFDEFSREHTETENKIQGTGLGMPIVKKMVDLMGGAIQVESELGKGTTFVITIPHRIAAEPKAELKQEHRKEVNYSEGKRILLAEDNDLNAEIAMEILKETGFMVERAKDGIVCVEMMSKAATDYYDLILMDIQMPNMDGYEATKRIRSFEDPGKANIPIIAMTANAFEVDKRNALEAGMNDHLAKPIVVSELIDTLKKLFE